MVTKLKFSVITKQLNNLWTCLTVVPLALIIKPCMNECPGWLGFVYLLSCVDTNDYNNSGYLIFRLDSLQLYSIDFFSSLHLMDVYITRLCFLFFSFSHAY
jgi:hypothetical protein